MGAVKPPAATAQAIAELARGADEIGVHLPSDSIERFQIYIETLLLWQRRLSLTTAATPLAIVRSHILDSLWVARFVQRGDRVADLGSGAGFPGVPLAIACPACTVALVEARRKKANFLREVVRAARLINVEVFEERAESLGADRLWRCDLVASRAVWRLPDFLRVSERLLRTGGLAIAMKSPKAPAEAAGCGGIFSPVEVVEYRLHGGVQHVLLVYRKR